MTDCWKIIFCTFFVQCKKTNTHCTSNR
jgi:hypothetical protein